MVIRFVGAKTAQVITGLLIAAALMATLPAAAWAHAKLRRAEPAPGSAVATAPKLVRVVFNEELDVKRSTLSVWDGRGTRVDDGKGGVDLNDMDHASMVAKLKATRPGIYTVRWKAVSADDKFVAQGSFRYTVKPAAKQGY
jgi:methionine-rich copper-binding protein CopC